MFFHFYFFYFSFVGKLLSCMIYFWFTLIMWGSM